jgi:hypothetical protein
MGLQRLVNAKRLWFRTISGAQAVLNRFLFVTLAAVALLGVAAIGVAPRPGQAIAAVFPVSTTEPEALRALAQADGWLVGPGPRPWILFARGTPDLPRALQSAGALWVIDAEIVQSCLSLIDRARRPSS